MKYEELIDSDSKKHIIIDNEDGSFKSFPAVEDNPEYVAFLNRLDGNDPDEFWTSEAGVL